MNGFPVVVTAFVGVGDTNIAQTRAALTAPQDAQERDGGYAEPPEGYHPPDRPVVVPVGLLMRAEFELTHSIRHGDIDGKIIDDLRRIIAFTTAQPADKPEGKAVQQSSNPLLDSGLSSEAVQAVRDEVLERAELYSALRSMHWTDGKLAVIEAKDLKLGVQTYSGEMLDDAIRSLQKTEQKG